MHLLLRSASSTPITCLRFPYHRSRYRCFSSTVVCTPVSSGTYKPTSPSGRCRSTRLRPTQAAALTKERATTSRTSYASSLPSRFTIVITPPASTTRPAPFSPPRWHCWLHEPCRYFQQCARWRNRSVALVSPACRPRLVSGKGFAEHPPSLADRTFSSQFPAPLAKSDAVCVLLPSSDLRLHPVFQSVSASTRSCTSRRKAIAFTLSLSRETEQGASCSRSAPDVVPHPLAQLSHSDAPLLLFLPGVPLTGSRRSDRAAILIASAAQVLLWPFRFCYWICKLRC